MKKIETLYSILGLVGHVLIIGLVVCASYRIQSMKQEILENRNKTLENREVLEKIQEKLEKEQQWSLTEEKQ